MIGLFIGIYSVGKNDALQFVILDLGVKFPFQPGDVVFINSHLLQHFVTEWEPYNFPDGRKGGRYSIIQFNHEKIVEWGLSDNSSRP